MSHLCKQFLLHMTLQCYSVDAIFERFRIRRQNLCSSLTQDIVTDKNDQTGDQSIVVLKTLLS